MNKKTFAIIDDLKNNREKEISEHRKKYRPRFIKWFMNHYHITYGEANEAFDKAYLIFCKNIITGKYKPGKAKPETYLWEIGKNCTREIIRETKRKPKTDEKPVSENHNPTQNTIEGTHQDEHYKFLFSKVYKHLPCHCGDLIKMKMHKLPLEEIMKTKGYKSIGATKTAVSKCFKTFKEIALKLGRDYFY